MNALGGDRVFIIICKRDISKMVEIIPNVHPSHYYANVYGYADRADITSFSHHLYVISSSLQTTL
jgi:hypothetical protein